MGQVTLTLTLNRRLARANFQLTFNVKGPVNGRLACYCCRYRSKYPALAGVLSDSLELHGYGCFFNGDHAIIVRGMFVWMSLLLDGCSTVY